MLMGLWRVDASTGVLTLGLCQVRHANVTALESGRKGKDLATNNALCSKFIYLGPILLCLFMILLISDENQITRLELSSRSKNFNHLCSKRYLADILRFIEMASYYPKSDTLRMPPTEIIGMNYGPKLPKATWRHKRHNQQDRIPCPTSAHSHDTFCLFV